MSTQNITSVLETVQNFKKVIISGDTPHFPHGGELYYLRDNHPEHWGLLKEIYTLLLGAEKRTGEANPFWAHRIVNHTVSSPWKVDPKFLEYIHA